MKKIAHWLLEKAKKDMRTDPFTTPSRRTKLSYYFDNLVRALLFNGNLPHVSGFIPRAF